MRSTSSLIAEFVFMANRKKVIKTIMITSDHYIDASPRSNSLKNAPTKYCFGLVSRHSRDRSYYFCTQTHDDCDDWLDNLSSLVEVRNWESQLNHHPNGDKEPQDEQQAFDKNEIFSSNQGRDRDRGYGARGGEKDYGRTSGLSQIDLACRGFSVPVVLVSISK